MAQSCPCCGQDVDGFFREFCGFCWAAGCEGFGQCKSDYRNGKYDERLVLDAEARNAGGRGE